MMLSIKDLRYYCRTCLVKLEKAHDDNSDKSIPTKKHPELENLIQFFLVKSSACDERLSLYAPFLCRSCFDKWLDFEKFYQLAVKTNEKIRKILEKEIIKSETSDTARSEHFKNYDKYFLDTEDLVDIHEIEKYEITAPFFSESELSNHQKSSIVESDNLELEKKHDICSRSSSSSSRSYPDKPNVSENDAMQTKRNRCTTKSKCVLKGKYRCRKSAALKSTVESDTPRATLNETTDEKNDEHVLKKIRYQCEHCNKYFWEKKKFEGHMKQAHEGIKKPFQCNQCDKAYNLYKTLLQHKRECHSEKAQESFKCDQCDKVFKTAVILKQHVANRHSERKEAMRSICDQCGFIAAHQYSLARHIINKHTVTDQIKCDQCPKVFKTRYSLKYHILGNHNPLNIKPFQCSECQMGFTRKTLLNQHKRTHLKYTERIKCDFEGCQVRFIKHGDKTHHMRLVHLKVKQHICDFCGEAFGAMQTLRHHRFIHTGEKPYKCNVCGQGFRQRTAMKTHRKIHFGKQSENQDVINNLPEINLSLVNDLNAQN